MILNENEQTIIQAIRKNPYITQQELADVLELSRPTAANLISGLVKKGYIRGKAYVLNEPKQIVCIGGANIDRKFYVKDKLQLHTSNPIRSTQSAGGVARNIAENLGRLGMDVAFLSTCGNDAEWSFIEESSSLYMNLDHISVMPKESTGAYTAVLDDTGDMFVAFADMDIFDHITPALMERNAALLGNAQCMMADLNCPKDTLLFLSRFAKDRAIPFVLVTVSAPKMDRLPEDLNGVSWLITNLDESESYFDDSFQSNEAWEQSVKKWLELGVEHVVVTNGAKGAMVGSNEENIKHIPAMETAELIDVTGAGDAFSAAVIHTWLKDYALMDIAKAGIVNAAKTLQSSYTVRQDLSASQLKKDMEELS